ncbi:MAG: hypothetical protein KBD25_00025 [Rickettsiaceae bacterium]|nr:hypothetical protein [Rickettsiaceae bacterium]
MTECLDKIASDSPIMSYKVDKITTISDNGKEIELDYNYGLEIEARNGSHSPMYFVYASAPLFFGQGLKVYKTENQIENICGPIDPFMSSCGCRCDKISLEGHQTIDDILDINSSYDTATMVHVPFYKNITLHLSGKRLDNKF